MASEILKRDENHEPVAGFVTDDSNQYIKMARIDDATKGLKVLLVGGTGSGTVTSITASTGLTATPNPIIGAGTISLDSKLSPMDSLAGNALKILRVNAGETAVEYFTTTGTGTVTSVSVVTNQGVSGSVATATTTPAITLSLGALTGVTSLNGLVITANTGTITTGIWNGTPISLTSYVTGTLPVANGGTGATTLTGVLVGTGTTAVSVIANPSADTLFGWDNTDTLQKYITIGTGLTYTHATHTLSSTGSGGTVTSVSGTANRITSTGGATPVIDISASYVGQSSITTLGTIATGLWNGTIITSGFGGTGNGFTKFTGATTSEKTYTLPNSSTTILTTANTITVGQGGTGATTLTAHGVLIGNTTGVINATTAGTSGQVLTSNGASSDPTFQTFSGTLSYSNGVGTFGAASTTQTITHNLGVTPKRIIFNAVGGNGSNVNRPILGSSNGGWDASNQGCAYTGYNSSNISGNSGTQAAYVEFFSQSGNNTNTFHGIIGNVTSTTFDVVWTSTTSNGSYNTISYSWFCQS